MICDIIGRVTTYDPNLSSSLVALAQVNTGFFTVSIALLTILPTLIKLTRTQSNDFVTKDISIDKLDSALSLFKTSTLLAGGNALLTVGVLLYPTLIGMGVVYIIALINAGILALGGKKVVGITKNAL